MSDHEKETALENARLRQALETTRAAQLEYISTITHELRIPLTSIRGYADLLERGLAGPLNEQQAEFITVIQRNLARMSALLRDLGDLNKLDDGRLRFEPQSFDLGPVVADAVARIRETAVGREQTLATEIDADLPAVEADPARVGQVLDKLLSNATLYTPAGGTITVRAEQRGDIVEVTVVDTGIGISEADQAQLFTPFFRSEDEPVREQTGWGLGLAVAREMVKAQGGEMSFESAPGAGSAFHFTLPPAT